MLAKILRLLTIKNHQGLMLIMKVENWPSFIAYGQGNYSLNNALYRVNAIYGYKAVNTIYN